MVCLQVTWNLQLQRGRGYSEVSPRAKTPALMRPVIPLLFVAFLAGCNPGSRGSAPAGRDNVEVRPVASGALRVTFLDVGQGDAALVQAPGGTSVLIDGGPSGAGPDVVKALRAAGIEKLDWMVASHPHEDHIGGLIDVLELIPAKFALDSGYNHGTATQKKYLSLLKQAGAQGKLARAGGRYELDSGAVLEVLAPQEPLLKGTDSDPNNNSVVARLVFGESEFLFTGDMEEDQRARLVAGSPGRLRADVLKVAHHGSHNGTDPVFLKLVDPEYAVISCGKGNDYGHPHREAMEALLSSGARVVRTDESGSISFRTDGRTLELVDGTRAAGKPAGESPAAGEALVGNAISQVYHSPECGSLPAKDRRVSFASAAQATRAGFRPHAACIKE